MKLIRFTDISLRYKIPLRVCALVLITAIVVTGTMVFREYDESRRDLVAHAAGLGRVLADTLTAPMIHDDLWRAFEVIRSPQKQGGSSFETLAAETVVVLDQNLQVFVSTQPQRFPLGINPAQFGGDFTGILARLENEDSPGQHLLEPAGSGTIYMVTPIIADGVLLGRLILGYSRQVFIPRLGSLVARAALVTLIALAVVLPLSAWWGRRLADPLVTLASAMDQVAVELPDPDKLASLSTGDEVGHLATAFRGMLADLHEKKRLEQQMLVSERLAAVGRISAGIAHEINNPLGGMLNALSTLRRHGALDPQTEKTTSMLERGLTQIRDTVAALLVEAKIESHSLTPDDFEDIHILVGAAAKKKNARLAWDNSVDATLPLNSTLVRQILLNLLQNAVQAIEPGGIVNCHTHVDAGHLVIVVENDGAYIPEDRLPFLFEPFATDRREGHGLGLWVTYQIVRKLEGGLDVDSRFGLTRFTIDLPLPESA